MPLRALAVVAVVAAVFFITRCGSSPKAPESEADVRASVGRTLVQRAAAVMHHDRAAYLATDAATPWRDVDAARFDNLASVPLESWSLAVQAGTSVSHLYKVELAYQLVGIDPVPVASTEYLTFVQSGGQWLVSSDFDGDPSGLRSDVQLWDLGPVAMVRGSRSMVLGLGGVDRLKPFATLADLAVVKDTKIWGGAGWNGTAVVEVPSTGPQLAEMLGSDPGQLQGIAAMTTGELGKTTAAAPADRVLINPDVWATLSASGMQVVMGHELTHVETRTWTTSATPMWLSEGAADYSGYWNSGLPTKSVLQELRQELADGVKPVALPTSADFSASGAALSTAYQKSWLACRLIADTYGQAKLAAFYHAVGSGGSVGGDSATTGSASVTATSASGTSKVTSATTAASASAVSAAPAADPVDHAFRTVLGTTTEAFTAKWRLYVIATARG